MYILPPTVSRVRSPQQSEAFQGTEGQFAINCVGHHIGHWQNASKLAWQISATRTLLGDDEVPPPRWSYFTRRSLVCLSVCLPVCLFVCLLVILRKTTDRWNLYQKFICGQEELIKLWKSFESMSFEDSSSLWDKVFYHNIWLLSPQAKTENFFSFSLPRFGEITWTY